MMYNSNQAGGGEMTKRRTFTAEYKFRVALEAAKSAKTLAELAQEYQLHPNQISEWKLK